MEIGNKQFSVKDVGYRIVRYKAGKGTEYFIYARTSLDKLVGFVRIRINSRENVPVFKALEGCALIRELHVYGVVNIVNEKDKDTPQHYGIGKRLIQIGEIVAMLHGKEKIAVISGVGVRNYYRKRGYKFNQDGEYMIKDLINLYYYIFIFIAVGIIVCMATQYG